MTKQNRPATRSPDEPKHISVLAVKDDSLAVERVKVAVSALRGPWVVHRTVSRGRTVPCRWSVSHVPTGKTMAADLKTKRQGLEIAERLLDLPAGDDKRIPVETRLGFCKVLRNVCGQASLAA